LERYRVVAVGVIVAPALLAAAKDIIPTPRLSGSFSRTMIRHAIVPITAMIADIAAGRHLRGGWYLFIGNLLFVATRN
jgi:hypothetical protein